MTATSPVVYEIFVRSFCDSNNDGIGDLQGVISKLDYIKELGATAIWLMPIHPSPSYHKYDIDDYYAIHPDYGTMADMEQFIREAHERELKVILDLVINHTSWSHPWFKASASSKTNEFRDYYVWRNYDEVKNEIEKKTTTFDSDNLTQWHEWPDSDERYYGFFWKGMPDLNFDHRPVRDEVYKIARFWLDKGIDGFRLDAAKHIYPDDRLDDTRKFWEEFKTEVHRHKPDAIIVGEIWAEPNVLATFMNGLPSLFNFDLANAIATSVNGERPDEFVLQFQKTLDAYRQLESPLQNAILLSNHDMDRIRSVVGTDERKAKLAASILLTIPGTVYLYYGEEIGMLGEKPDMNLREPFLWDEQTAQDSHWMTPVYITTAGVTPLSVQKTDAHSIYSHYRSWIAYRKSASLGTADARLTSSPAAGVTALSLSATGIEYIAYHNLTARIQSFPKPENFSVAHPASIDLHEKQITLQPFESIVIRKKQEAD